MDTLLPSRRRDRHPDPRSDIIVEATPPEVSSDDQKKPEQISLPPSRPPSTNDNRASVAEVELVRTTLQDTHGRDQNNEGSIQELVDGHNEAGDHDQTVSTNLLHRRPSGVTGTTGNVQWTRKLMLDENKPVDGFDPFAEGAKKLDEFWPIYVKEADSYDKELSEGWNG